MRFVILGASLVSVAAWGQQSVAPRSGSARPQVEDIAPNGAQVVSVVVMDAQGLTEANVKKVHHAAVEELRGLTTVPISEAYDRAKKGCLPSDVPCQREHVKGTAVALWLAGSKDNFSVDAVFWLDGERVSAPKTGDAALDSLEFGLKPVLDAVLPGWMKKGWGGLRLSQEPPAGTTLKLDGRVVTGRRPDVVPVPAGTHQVDLLLPDGSAVLQRVDVAEASRTVVESARPAPASSSSGGFSTLRLLSYAAWMVGTAAVFTAFMFGIALRSTERSACRPDTRDCATLTDAQQQAGRASGYAAFANGFLFTGLAFGVAGAGLFTFDVLR